MAALPGGTGASASQGQSKLASFRPNTRQRLQKIGNVPAAFGTTQQLTFPQVGLLSRIYLYANLAITDTAATPNTPASTFGPWNALKRITGSTNLGTATVFDLSGYGAFMVDKITDTAVETAAVSSDVTTDVFYNYPTSGVVQNVASPIRFIVMIPVAANDGPQFQIGLINLQAPEIRFTLTLVFGASADIYPGSTTAATQSLGGTVTIYYQYYEVPNPDSVQLPPRVLHRLIEDRTPIVAVGDFTYLVPRQGIMLQTLHNLILNGAISKNTTDLTSRRLVFNKTDTPYSVDYIVDRISNRFRYGFGGGSRDLPAGMYVWDFFDSDQAPTRGDLRDAVDTEALSTLESIVTIASGASLGANNNFLDTIRRITQSY